MKPGDRLRLFCEAKYGKKKGAITALARDLGMRPPNLHKYLSGGRIPGSEVLPRLALIGCNVNWLLSGEGEMFTENEVGRRLRDELAKPSIIAEPMIYGRQPQNDWKRKLEEELYDVRLKLEHLAGEERMVLLEREVRLLEMKAEMLLQENLFQLGQILAYERILGPGRTGEALST